MTEGTKENLRQCLNLANVYPSLRPFVQHHALLKMLFGVPYLEHLQFVATLDLLLRNRGPFVVQHIIERSAKPPRKQQITALHI